MDRPQRADEAAGSADRRAAGLAYILGSDCRSAADGSDPSVITHKINGLRLARRTLHVAYVAGNSSMISDVI
jgi:hypothetical protein